jgi:hypothetical protein
MTQQQDASYFEDADELGSLMTDTRAQDARTISEISAAQEIIEAFRSNDVGTRWTGLDRNDVADRLLEIVQDSRVIQQGGLNLCGPASLVCMWAGRDPLGFASFATALFDSGSSDLGSLRIAPSDELLSQDFSTIADAAATRAADWMVLSAIRNTTNAFWQGSWVGDPGQELAGLTRPEELAAWLEATGAYARVRNEGNWATPAGIPHATNIEMHEGRDVALLIHGNLLKAAQHRDLDDSFLLSQFPNHYVVALNSATVAVMDGEVDGRRFRKGDVLLSIWSWGRDDNNLNLAVPAPDFVANYYGAVIADLD